MTTVVETDKNKLFFRILAVAYKAYKWYEPVAALPTTAAAAATNKQLMQ